MISKNVITIDDVIARTKIQLLIGNTTEHDAYLEIVISEALRHLDSISLYVKRQCTLDIVDNKAELPKGYMKLLGARFTSTVLMNQYVNGVVTLVPITTSAPIFYVDYAWFNSLSIPINNDFFRNYSNTFQIVNGVIHFNSMDIESGTIDIAFMGLNVDEQGRLIIYEEYERALSSYACYMFTLAYAEQKGVGISDRYYETWKAQKSWIKGGAWKDEFQRTKMDVASAVNAMVIDTSVNFL